MLPARETLSICCDGYQFQAPTSALFRYITTCGCGACPGSLPDGHYYHDEGAWGVTPFNGLDGASGANCEAFLTWFFGNRQSKFKLRQRFLIDEAPKGE